MIGSDGLPHDASPHPRLWGTFPRVLGHYSRDLGLFPLEVAVHKMTGLPAARFGLHGRGRVAPGAFADLVLFDGDPTQDITALKRIALVVTQGRSIDPSAVYTELGIKPFVAEIPRWMEPR
jgi:N-acyl-D-amino-acid deacylase